MIVYVYIYMWQCDTAKSLGIFLLQPTRINFSPPNLFENSYHLWRMNISTSTHQLLWNWNPQSHVRSSALTGRSKGMAQNHWSTWGWLNNVKYVNTQNCKKHPGSWVPYFWTMVKFLCFFSWVLPLALGGLTGTVNFYWDQFWYFVIFHWIWMLYTVYTYMYCIYIYIS